MLDSQIDTLPSDRAMWLFGAGNKFAPVVVDGLKAYGATFDSNGLRTATATL